MGLQEAAQHDKRLVIEKAVRGRELECAVLGKKKLLTSCVGEVRYKSEWYNFEAKYSATNNEILIPIYISL